ncbi:MAG TPA: hypothetical protein VMA83_01845 [Solirubrobacteraceae bacterium]|nr:hypothetical protein [Solirubrobacteraceae bacterium]
MGRFAALFAVACALALPSAANAASADTAATSAYLRADDALARVGAAKIHEGEQTLTRLLSRLKRECPDAAAGSPEDEESTLLSDELIGTMVLSVNRNIAGPLHTFIRATEHLHWRNAAANRAVHAYVGDLKAMIALPIPSLCKDVAAWAANVRASRAPPLLTSFTRSFAPKFMDVWVATSDQPGALVRIERGANRSLAARVARLEEKIEAFEARAVENYTLLMNALELWP